MYRIVSRAALVALMVGGCQAPVANDSQGVTETAYIEDMDHFVELVIEVQDKAFPELSDTDLEIETFYDPSSFMKSQPHVGSYLNPLREVRHRVHVNPGIFDDCEADCLPPMTVTAAQAVIAHELAHIVSYYQPRGIARAGWNQLFKGRRLKCQERRTDLEAMVRGYATGLKEFREWIYPILPDEEAVQTKRERYFTPPEIDAVMAAIDANPELYEKWSDRDNCPPLLGEPIE